MNIWFHELSMKLVCLLFWNTYIKSVSLHRMYRKFFLLLVFFLLFCKFCRQFNIFLWTTHDALIRYSLKGVEVGHTIFETFTIMWARKIINCKQWCEKKLNAKSCMVILLLILTIYCTHVFICMLKNCKHN